MSGVSASANRLNVVDIDLDPTADRARRRQTLGRIGLPLGGVGLIIGFLLGIALYADSANRAGVLGLSDTLLRGLQERIALQVGAYLEPAAHATLLAQSMLGRGGATARADEAYAFAASVLRETPQVANVLFADGAGDFMLVRRAIGGAPGTTETKRILVAPDRRVEWTTRTEAGAITARHTDPDDPYDARTRGWFTGARASGQVFWSGTYVFFSERAPGITASVHGPDADPDVVGIDIKLDALSHFLGGLSIGRTGRAYIVSSSGEMIAGPNPSTILREQDGKLAPAKVAEVGDPGLSGAWDHFRLEGPGTRVIDVRGDRLIAIATPLGASGQDWVLVITVPEAEFSGFISTNTQRAGLLSLVVVALALGLAVLLVRQGLRADRADRAVGERSAAVRAQSAAFARLADAAHHVGPDGTPPPALTETLAEATGARRAGVWRLLGHALRCDDSYEPATGGHVAGIELARGEVSALIEALLRGEEIDVPDARKDRRTYALNSLIMAPLGSTSLFAVPVLQNEVLRGMVLLEDARRDGAARDIVRAAAQLVALCLPADAAAPLRPEVPQTGMPRTEVRVTKEPDNGTGLDPAMLPVSMTAGPAQASVLVLRLPEAAFSPGAAGHTLAHRIACAAQDIAAARGVPYMKMLGSSIVAATGYADTALAGADAAQRLADAALDLREACARLMDADDDAAGFRLGLDTGPVQGGALGTGPGLFNLWGAGVSGADDLASTAPPGAIQASEQAYTLLRQSFLFRARGLFHRPGIGEARSYVLAGRV